MATDKSILQGYIKVLLTEKNVLAIGECYPFAVEKATAWFRDHVDRTKPRGKRAPHPDLNDKDKFKVVHGRATNKWSGESYLHAWVEMGDTIFDDQTKRTKPDGIDREVYYDHYQPEPIVEYTAEEVLVNCIKGGPGPWDEESRNVMRQRDAWLQEKIRPELMGTKMKITKTRLKQLIKEELDSAMGQKVYLVTWGYDSESVGVFSSLKAAEEAVLRDIEFEHQEQARERLDGTVADYGADTTVKKEDYYIEELELDKGRS